MMAGAGRFDGAKINSRSVIAVFLFLCGCAPRATSLAHFGHQPLDIDFGNPQFAGLGLTVSVRLRPPGLIGADRIGCVIHGLRPGGSEIMSSGRGGSPPLRCISWSN